MSADSERLIVGLFKSHGFGAFRFRQPAIHTKRYGKKVRGSSYVRPNQPLDLLVRTTLELTDEVVEKYDLKRCYKVDGRNYLNFNLGVEEKKTSYDYVDLSSKISRKRHKDFLKFCMENSLVPCYMFTFVKGTKTPTENSSTFSVRYVCENFRKPHMIFRDSALGFPNILYDVIDGYLENCDSWSDDFDVITYDGIRG